MYVLRDFYPLPFSYVHDLTVENPAKKWPGTFNEIALFVKYPYLLPALVASAVTFTGKSE
jgi:hypothetical protein